MDHQGDRFLIVVNDEGAENFRLVEAPLSSPGRDHWRELVPARQQQTGGENLALRRGNRTALLPPRIGGPNADGTGTEREDSSAFSRGQDLLDGVAVAERQRAEPGDGPGWQRVADRAGRARLLRGTHLWVAAEDWPIGWLCRSSGR